MIQCVYIYIIVVVDKGNNGTNICLCLSHSMNSSCCHFSKLYCLGDRIEVENEMKSSLKKLKYENEKTRCKIKNVRKG